MVCVILQKNYWWLRYQSCLQPLCYGPTPTIVSCLFVLFASGASHLIFKSKSFVEKWRRSLWKQLSREMRTPFNQVTTVNRNWICWVTQHLFVTFRHHAILNWQQNFRSVASELDMRSTSAETACQFHVLCDPHQSLASLCSRRKWDLFIQCVPMMNWSQIPELNTRRELRLIYITFYCYGCFRTGCLGRYRN
jgi:hypothetical protein